MRFARLIRDTLAPEQRLTHLLDLAMIRRDAVLLRAILMQLHEAQAAAPEAEELEAERPARRVTLLPPPRDKA
jgi:hypothetical protein